MKRLLSILPFLLIIGLLLASCAESGLSPSSDFYVYDEAGVLTGETHDYIVEQNRRLESLTGAQIVVMTVRTTGDEEMDDFATRVFNAWGIGDEEEDNGVLLLLSIEEDDYWVLQGQGLEDILSSGILKLMLNEHMEPHFAIKDYDAGVRETFDALLDHLESAYSITIAEGSEDIIGEAETENEPTLPHEVIPAMSVYRLVRRAVAFCMRLFVMVVALVPTIGVPAVIIIIILISASKKRKNAPPPGANRNPYSSRTRVHYTPGRGPSGFTPPPPPPPGGFGTHRSTTFGGSRPAGNSKTYRPTGGFGGPRPTGGFGGTRPSGFGGSRPSGGFGGSRPSGGFHGGGGHSRGGGAGRR